MGGSKSEKSFKPTETLATQANDDDGGEDELSPDRESSAYDIEGGNCSG